MNAELFGAHGEMSARLRAFDWSASGLGPPDVWPTSLRTIAGVVLGSRFPMLVWWGADLIQIYNDGYRPILGDKHPASVGASGRTVWAEIWHIVGPMAEGILAGGQPTWSEHLLLPMRRKGFLEETYFTFSYSPIPDDQGGVGGVLVTCQETTEEVQGHRQLRTLRDLGTGTSGAHSPRDACDQSARILAANAADVPFALLYLVAPGGHTATLAAAAGVASEGLDGMETVALDEGAAAGAVWPLAACARLSGPVDVDHLPSRVRWPGGPLAASADRAVVLPLTRSGDVLPDGFAVFGVSPSRTFDERYAGFLTLAADQIATAIAHARSLEDARARAEALEALDRAKTAFFSNVSHEFRTPLTLMLGPTEEALASTPPRLEGEPLEIVHRNERRLLKLVNALLDFARIEAGRVQGRFQPTDLSAFTADLASMFRSAVERAGLTLDVTCTATGLVYVDRAMWEQIVMNLLSNALKFTFAGGIRITLADEDAGVVLEVADTGTGIAAGAIPQLFRRFHRIEGAHGRTHEGSGIGLAMVHELVRLHAGKVSVESTPGVGSTFRVDLRRGTGHLPADQVSEVDEPAAPVLAPVFAEEAQQWEWLATGADEYLVKPFSPRELLVRVESQVALARGRRERAVLLAREREARVEAELQKQHLHDLFMQAPTLIAVLRGPDFVVELANEGICRAWSREHAAVVGQPLLDVLSPLHRQSVEPLLRSVYRTGTTQDGRETPCAFDRGDGTFENAFFNFVYSPFRGADGRVARIFVIASDVTDQVRARQQLEDLRRAAEGANRAKDEFLAMLGHELRNPLSPIVTALQLMKLRGDGADRERTVIERQVAHLTRLVDDLLDVSRIARGKVELKVDIVEMADVVVKAIEMASPLLEQRAHALELEIPRRGLAVRADATRLAQVLSNLLTNAAKYTPAGGRIAVTAAPDHDAVVVRVRDTGIGISPDVLPHVFDLFVQERQGLDRAHGGLGLGLTIVRNLVQLHGGTVSATSDGIGKGSEFLVRLPLAVEAAPAAVVDDGDVAPSRTHVTGRRVLVVDDNDDSAAMLAEALRLRGHDVRVAHDGPAALAVSATFRPQVAFLDIGLPVMDGYELASRLRQQPELASTRLLALTGYGQESDSARSRAAGFHAHLVKPLDLRQLDQLLGLPESAEEGPPRAYEPRRRTG